MLEGSEASKIDLWNLITLGVCVQSLLSKQYSINQWINNLFVQYKDIATMAGVSFMEFPQLALGLSGLETGLEVWLRRFSSSPNCLRGRGEIRLLSHRPDDTSYDFNFLESHSQGRVGLSHWSSCWEKTSHSRRLNHAGGCKRYQRMITPTASIDTLKMTINKLLERYVPERISFCVWK